MRWSMISSCIFTVLGLSYNAWCAEDSWVTFSRNKLQRDMMEMGSLAKGKSINFEKLFHKYLLDGDADAVMDFYASLGVPKEAIPKLNETRRLLFKCSVDGVLPAEAELAARKDEWDSDALTSSLINLYFFHRTGDFGRLRKSLSSEEGEMALEYLSLPTGLIFDRDKLYITMTGCLYESAAKILRGEVDAYHSRSILGDYRKWMTLIRRRVIDERQATDLIRKLDEVAGGQTLSDLLGEYFKETVDDTSDYTAHVRAGLALYLATVSNYSRQHGIEPISRKFVAGKYMGENEYSAVCKMIGQ